MRKRERLQAQMVNKMMDLRSSSFFLPHRNTIDTHG